MAEKATICLDVVDHHVVYKGKRHIFLGKTGPKERWIDTHRPDVTYQFHLRTLTISASASYLGEKELLGFVAKSLA
ncbi:hypothetical protein EN836_23025 [Mesorhizobium sp. M1C.F.Ca.ET.193.01.1.1]|uniref:hypothetical protein n=1 Tax=unclassified Mesorhizobium TaxID=325217 RepID=UPI000FD36758|nr:MULTISPECIES: hypothetical protein [unclassified Mesorhizobium]RVD68636.1 hypothetical protein EN751_30350 [Mesorhizobium sp. M4A.F.Ca.ET.029.04.2.1]TGS95553.1 hypothetical protein EN820_43745 [bacterium M00.F.Ca.ET.177.01.1.1]TGQ51630.1 hypothetical protein EN853_23015 [Mesorhizobium sp. M1C.F.Ca.ET.210.01.1.1]TGQ67860.1 hypothetical protein EN855_023025 [Mesorhizobium sp. M1C.F.Ca.ET.212.01.1.1]TGR02449.1 hypothetical protein EN847_23015 [Mesorhizobium sp. M1C.F.Ca.ET.204.01.1.1]